MKRIVIEAYLTLFIVSGIFFACDKEKDILSDNIEAQQIAGETVTEFDIDPQLLALQTHQLIVQNRKLAWSDGMPCILKHADSPEGRLRTTWATDFQNESALLAQIGMNAITCTMRGDDACCTSITPIITCSGGGQCINGALIREQHAKIENFFAQCAANGERGVCIAYLGERTNFQSISLDMYKKWIDTLAVVYTGGNDISGQMIWGWEEIWNGSNSGTASYINNITSYINQKMPKSLTMYHNNPGQKAWRSTSPVLNVDIINLQETSVNAMNTSANDAYSYGYAVHLHELYPGFKLNNSQSTNLSLLSQLLGIPTSIVSGYGIFSSDYDGQKPDASKLRYVYEALVAALDGTAPPPPPPSGFILSYATNGSRTGADSLTQGIQLNSGNYVAFVDGVTSSTQSGWQFKLFNSSGSTLFTQSENSAPISWRGETNGLSNLYPLTVGSYRLLVTRNGASVFDVTFSVDGIVPPPPPPPPAGFELRIANNTSKANSAIFGTGATIPAASYVVYVSGVSDNIERGWKFQLFNSAGNILFTQNENSTPIDWKGGSVTIPTLYPVSVGSYRLLVTRNSAVIYDINFSVQ